MDRVYPRSLYKYLSIDSAEYLSVKSDGIEKHKSLIEITKNGVPLKVHSSEAEDRSPRPSSYKIVTGLLFSITKIPRRNYRDSRMERRFIETPTKLRPFHDGMSCAILLAATAPFASSARVQPDATKSEPIVLFCHESLLKRSPLKTEIAPAFLSKSSFAKLLILRCSLDPTVLRDPSDFSAASN